MWLVGDIFVPKVNTNI